MLIEQNIKRVHALIISRTPDRMEQEIAYVVNALLEIVCDFFLGHLSKLVLYSHTSV